MVEIMREREKGSFTLPGESGYEELTLKMAEKWGADVIRDSDGTKLSDEILDAGYGIYSTVCIIRDHNEWAKKHMNRLQQSFLMTEPVMAHEEFLAIHLMDGFFHEQFLINDSEDAIRYYQVFDRTTQEEITAEHWTYEKETGNIVIQGVKPFHTYTVNFLAYRIWEEISMYNHVTNNWNKEHLMPVDPISKEAQDYLYKWLDDWCKNHEATTVVRFTSMFYNFVWIWGESEKRRSLFSDWASYDFTVSPQALDEFKKKYGYALTSEDFINKGNLHVTHMPPNKKQLDYMEFINQFVVKFGRKLVDLVHKYGKQAYVFYDDSWVGVEPYSKHFKEFGFDGLIKCVFSGFEARLCAGVDVKTHELRLHPYLFPVGLGGAPTFIEGGDPVGEAKKYWLSIRRALLRQKIDRIGLGGYLHLVEGYPDFCDYIEKVADEFRLIKTFHEIGEVYTLPCKVAVLHSWGKIRSWSLSGHFHETYMHDLIHVNEALSGLPVDVSFINFEDVKNGALKGVDVLINAGAAGTAWSGGDAWNDSIVVEKINKWILEGGSFVGINEPSASDGFFTYFRLSQALGVDEDTGAKVCHGKWQFEKSVIEGLIPKEAEIKSRPGRYLTDENTKVLLHEDNLPTLTIHEFGKGKGIYLSEFTKSNGNIRLLLNILLYAKNLPLNHKYISDNINVECAFYPASKMMAVINNSEFEQKTKILTDNGELEFVLEPFDTQMVNL